MIMMKNKFVSLFFFLIVTFSASIIGGIVSSKFKDPWYSSIIKPSFNPPDWIFAPVWSLLYFFMAYAIWNVWIKSREKRLIYLYFIHLVFNTTWSIIFFGFHNITLALLNLIIIIIFIVILILKYKRISNLSACLMIPYLLWSFYALILNMSLIILN
tara:strand:+ start:357 stop:827 length:471 start_codon:yes stop_codon:yes gene_type:complete